MIDNAAILFGCLAMIFVGFKLARASDAARRAKADRPRETDNA